MPMGEVEGTSALSASERVQRIDRPPEFLVTIHREIRVGDADACAFDDVRRESAEAGALVDARLEHDESLLSRSDSTMGEYTKLHSVVPALGEHYLGCSRRTHARASTDKHGGPP